MKHITNAGTLANLTMLGGSLAATHNLKNPKARATQTRNMTDEEAAAAAQARKGPSRQVRRAYERARAKGQGA